MARKLKGSTPEAQQELPGVLPAVVKIPALTRACGILRATRGEYQKAGMDAKEAGERVRALMHEHGLTYYEFKGGSIELEVGKEKIKIVLGSDEDEGDLLGNEE